MRLVTCAEDLGHIDGYDSYEAFTEAIENQTDAEVDVQIHSDGIAVSYVPGGGAFHAYPFDPAEVLGQAYDSEIDYEVRGEIIDQLENLLSEAMDSRGAGLTPEEHYVVSNRLHEFITTLLWSREVDLLGSELRLTDPHGDPLELVAWVVWDEAGRCEVERPCLPDRRPTEAVIRSDGWLEVTVKDSAAVPEWSGVTRPTPTLVVADLLLLEDPLALYDLAATMA